MLRSRAVAPPKDIVTAEDVLAVPRGGELVATAGAVVTPWARELAATRGVRITLGAPLGQIVVAVGADHGGFALKEQIKVLLARLGHRGVDLGTHSTDAVDYPTVAAAVARQVASGQARFGVVVDGAGIGSAIAANKVRGVRAATVHDALQAKNAREHNDANVLVLGARFLAQGALHDVLETFLNTACTEERHRRRVRLIEDLER
jgi:ribose 5-phosphate isomerase B